MFQLLGKIIYFSTEELSWQDVRLEFSQLSPKAILPDSKANQEDQKKMKGGKTEPQYLCLSSRTQPDLVAAKTLTVQWQEPRKSLFASRSLSWITVLGPESTQLTPYAITAWNPKECGNLRGRRNSAQPALRWSGVSLTAPSADSYTAHLTEHPISPL